MSGGVLTAPDIGRKDKDKEERRALFNSVEKNAMQMVKVEATNGNNDRYHDDRAANRPKVSAEKVISLRRLWEEVDSKRARTLLSGAFIRYIFFVIIYLVALQYQKSAEPSFYQTNALRNHFVNSEWLDPTTRTYKTFKGIVTVEDFWSWMENKFLPNTYALTWSNGNPKDDYYKSVLMSGNRITKGFRLTQRRSVVNNCLMSERYNAFFPFCYPNTFSEGLKGKISKEPFGPYYDQQKYKYQKLDILLGELDSGFVVNFPFDRDSSVLKVAELKSDRFLDEATRWVRVDLATFNPSSNLFTHIEFMLNFDNTGYIAPQVRMTTLRTEVYLNTVRDYVQIVLEILVMIGVVMYLVGDIKDCLVMQTRSSHDSYFGNFWNWLDLVLILLFALDFAVWIAIITDKIRDDINVKLGPLRTGADLANGELQRQVLLDAVDMYGESMDFWFHRLKIQIYFVSQSFTVMVVMMRFLKYLAANSTLGTLVEAFVIMKTALLQFIIIVLASNVGFAYIGYMLFGDVMTEFHTFNQSFFTLLGTALGGGVTYAELAEANQVGAPILYIPFVMFFCFITLNLVIAVIVEAYQVQQAHRSKQVTLGHQLRMGLARHLPAFRRWAGAQNRFRYHAAPDNVQLRQWMQDWEWTEGVDEELTEEELHEKLADKNVDFSHVNYIFKRYDYCTRARDPPPPEPEVNDMVRELHKQVRALVDSSAIAQRKLDTILAGQDM